jgi:cyclophilin family peptidyl-prolyl cis-trans isomerase
MGLRDRRVVERLSVRLRTQAGHVIGSQFVITLTDMRHLAGQVTVIGAGSELDVVGRLAERVAAKAPERLARISVDLPAR